MGVLWGNNKRFQKDNITTWSVDHASKMEGGLDPLVARLLDVLGHEAVLGVVAAVKQGELALLLGFEGKGAPRLARVLAAVHKHHPLVPLLQALRHLHTLTHTLSRLHRN